MPLNHLRDVDVRRISLVKKGANRKRIFLYKSADESAGEELAVGRIVKSSGKDWSAFYVVVAEPGHSEEPGLLGDGVTPDVWESEEEIRKAAHRFMHNGGALNHMHGLEGDLGDYGKVVENAVALADFKVGEETIKKGSWYIAVEPNEVTRPMVESGDITGVSIEGTGLRIAKSASDEFTYLDATDYAMFEQVEEIAKAKDHSSKTHPNLDWSPGENWIDKLPKSMGLAFRRSWIYRAAKHMVYDKGMPRGRAFAAAVNAAKRGCATGDLNFKGPQQVNAKSRAEMCAAVALWERMKAHS